MMNLPEIVKSVEVPWFSEPPEATLRWDGNRGYLHFTDPKGNHAAVPVTKDETVGNSFGHVWHISIEDSTATVSPSIHYVGDWHSPNPVVFKLVDKGD
jgi:hypothetical protein